MPLILHKEIDSLTRLGVWKIDETKEELKDQVELEPAEEIQYQSFGSEVRKKQWLSYRLLLKKMLPSDPCFLEYDAFGKPHLKNTSIFLSVTHSGEYAAVITSRKVSVGIDIERLKDRIFRIKDKFLSADEEQHIGDDHRLEKMHIAWGAKESLYKSYGKPEVEFRRDIFIESFDYLCSGNGRCSARMQTPEGMELHDVFYEMISGFMLVYSMKTDKVKKK